VINFSTLICDLLGTYHHVTSNPYEIWKTPTPFRMANFNKYGQTLWVGRQKTCVIVWTYRI